MAHIILPNRWEQQPQYAAPPDPYWLNRKLCFLWNGSQPHELVTGRVPSARNALRKATPWGVAADCAASQANIEWNKEFCSTSDGNGLGDFTLLVYANPASSGAAIQHMLAQKNDTAGSPWGQAVMAAHCLADTSASSGSVAFFTYHATPAAEGVSATAVCDGKPHVWVGRRMISPAGDRIMTLHKDGVQIATSTRAETVQIVYTAAARYTAIGSRGNGSTESFVDDVYAAAMFNSALTDAEIQRIGGNAWELYQPLPRRLIFGWSAGGGATASGATLTGAGSVFAGAATAASAASGATLTGAGAVSAGTAAADSAAAGATLAGAGSVSAGAATADSTAAGAPLTGTGSVSAGSASGTGDATASGATLAGAGSVSAGAATADSTAAGAPLTGTGSVSAGSASGTGDATASGATLAGAGSVSAGAATADSTAAGAPLTGTGSVSAGSASGAPAAGAAHGAMTAVRRNTARDSASQRRPRQLN